MTKQEDKNDLMQYLMGEVEANMPSETQRKSMGQKSRKNPTDSFGFMREYEEEKIEDKMSLISVVEKQVQGVLAEVQYIAELLATQKKVKEDGAQVKDINEKIRKSIEKIKAYMDPQQEQALTAEAVNRRTSGGVSVEQNPLVKEMGGMPLEIISTEWQDKMVGQVLDKTEIENAVKQLKERVKEANQLKAKNKLTNKPTSKPGQQMTPKFQKLQQTVKYIMKNMPEPVRPEPMPKPFITPPRPF
jgi:hypothetical protein